ncbi:MFS transporter [Candidatus Woesearchaeota archaeon]|nr:MFS transporter [Candidatus Woesearchaeota archaeon]
MEGQKSSDYFLFACVYFLEGILGLSGIGLLLFMKEELGLSIAQVSVYSGLLALPWVLKPVYGLLSDYFPLFGCRRKSYLVLAVVFSSAGWITTSWVSTLVGFLAAQLLVDIGIASLDVVADGLAVQKSTDKNRGFIQALCWGSRSLGAIIAGYSGGYLLGYLSYRHLFQLTAIFPLLLLPIIALVTEPKPKRIIFSTAPYITRKIWLVILFLFLFFATPSFGSPFFFFLNEQLGFSPVLLGSLTSLASFGGLVGAMAYARFGDRYPVRPMLTLLVTGNLLLTMVYLLVIGPASASVIYLVNGFVGYVSLIACMSLLAKNCSPGAEATTFALATSIVNFAGNVVSPVLGGALLPLLGLRALIVCAALSHLLALWSLRYVR